MAKYQINAVGVYQYFLVLNSMMSNIENGHEFGPFPTREELLSFYHSLKVEPYMEEGPDLFGNAEVKKYSKSFAKGSELEWMNPLQENEFNTPNDFGHGIHEVLTRVENIQRAYQIE